MCEVVYSEPKLYVATKDIVVYKHVKPIGKTLFSKRLKCKGVVKGFKYKQDKVYKTNLEPFKNSLDPYDSRNVYVSSTGFYSYRVKYEPIFSCEKLAKFIIPKDAKYYLVYNVYISDQIKFINYV